MKTAFGRLMPAGSLWRGYRRAWLPGDLLAGLSAGAVVVPQAMAYGTIAGLPVQMGLYTCIAPMIIYAVLGGARRMSVSTTSTIVALTGVGLASLDLPRDDLDATVGAAATLTLLVGVVLLLCRLVRMGFLVETVSQPVLSGLKIGVGLTIVASQLSALLGIPAADGGFFADVANAVTSLPEVNTATVLISICTVAGLVALRRWFPRVPGPLVALVAGIGVVTALGLADDGVAVIPPVPRGLPVPSVPALEHVGALLPYAVAIALMSFLESVSVARSTRGTDDPPLDNNAELVALGAASLAGSFTQAVPAAGGFSQTLVNAGAGARSQLSELVTALLAVLTALVFAPALADLPQATLAAVVLLAVAGLIRVDDLVRIGRVSGVELTVAVVTGATALVTNLLVGVLVGVLLTFYLVLRALNHPVVVELRWDGRQLLPDGGEAVPGLLVLRIEGGLYTVNVQAVQSVIVSRAVDADSAPTVVLLDMRGTADTSVTVMDAFQETGRRLRRRGIELWFAAIPTRALARARRTGAWPQLVAAGQVHPTVDAALQAFLARKPEAVTATPNDTQDGP